MLALLFLVKIGLCFDTEKFIKYTGLSVNNKDEIAYSPVLSQSKCAARCLTKQDQCTIFRYEREASVCHLLQVDACVSGYGNTSIFSSNSLNLTVNTLLARGKPAQMSSSYWGNEASKGNDGEVPSSILGEQAYYFHTELERNPWWRVDMEEIQCVWAVWFMNRGYSAVVWRARNLAITVSTLVSDIMYNADNNDNRCGYVETPEVLNNTVICSQPLVGRFVQIQMMSFDYLHFYEVEVHGNGNLLR